MFNLIRVLRLKFRDKIDRLRCRNGHQYASLLRRRGHFASIGEDCYIDFSVNFEEPYLVEMGENVWLTDDVRLLTHDGSLSMLSRIYGETLRKFGAIRFGSNIFVGMNSTIMPGVRIGDGVIVAAGSVVTRNIEPNTIVGGNPARVIGKSSDLWVKWHDKQACFAYSSNSEKILTLSTSMKAGLL